MATEKEFELLDEYLSNRLQGEERAEFEKKLESDPQLKQEYQFQQSLVEGIRKARAAELKGMLKNIPVTSIPTGQSAVITKVISSLLVAGLVTTGIYLYLDKDSDQESQEEVLALEPKESDNSSQPIVGDDQSESESEPVESPELKEIAGGVENKATTETPNTEINKKNKAVSPREPVLEVFDPTSEGNIETQRALEHEQIELIENAIVTSYIEVEVDGTNKTYTFHYLFKDGKLILFGSFEKNLYEILEFINNESKKRTVFLYYKTNYYLLDTAKTQPTPLLTIRDKTLIKKLKEHREN